MLDLVFGTYLDARQSGWKWAHDIAGQDYNNLQYDGVCYRGVLFTGTLTFTQEPEEWKFSSYLNGFLHSFDDQPALAEEPEFRWFKDGKHHRDSGPASIYRGPPKEVYAFALDNKVLPFSIWLESIDIPDAEKVLLKMQYG